MNEILTVFASQEPAGLIVTWVILGFFAIGVLNVLSAWARLGLERTHVTQARRKLGDINSQFGAERMLKALSVPAGSLLGKRITRVLQLRAAGLGYRDVLQRLTVENVEGYGAMGRFIGTILTMLGLVGTVVGMSFAMVRMSGAFRSVNDVQALDQLTKALSGTLQGMQTAFACTLAGLASAVVLAVLNYFLRRVQSHVVRELEEFVTCELLPVLERVDPDADNAARAFAEVVSDASEQLTAIRTALAQVSERFAATGGGMMESAKTLSDAVVQLASATSTLDGRVGALEERTRDSRSIQDAIVTYHEDSRKFMERQTAQLETNLKKLLHDVNEHYRDGVRKHVDATQDRLTQVITDNQSRFSDVMGQHSTKLQSFSDMMLELYVNGRKPAAKDNQA